MTDSAKKELVDPVRLFSVMCVVRAAEAKKQNDHVYHEKLPPMEHLEAVQGNYDGLWSHINHVYYAGAALAKPNVFQPADPAVIGLDIFSRLVPMTAHEQSSVYR